MGITYFVFVLLPWEHCHGRPECNIHMCVYYIHHSLCGACFEDLTYGLCTYNFRMCITLELLWNTSNTALTLETWEIIFLKIFLIPQEIN